MANRMSGWGMWLRRSLLSASLLFVALPVHAQSIEARDRGSAETKRVDALNYLSSTPTLLDDPGGLRSRLEDAGGRIDLYYNHLVGLNVGSGRSFGDSHRQSGSADLILYAYLPTLVGIPGGEALTHVKSQFGDNINNQVDALSDPFDDADGDKSIYVDQLWYQHSLWQRTIQVRFGYLDQQTVLDRNAYANSEDKQFANTFLDNNSATIPLAIGLGVDLFVRPTDWLTLVVGFSDADGGLYRAGFDTAFDEARGFFRFLEIDFDVALRGPRGTLPGAYRFGALSDPRDRSVFGTDPGGTGPPDTQRDDVGFYLTVDQMVYREAPDSPQGVGVFVRYGYRDGDVNKIEHFGSLGGQYEGLLPDRAADVLGFGMYVADGSERMRNEVNPEFEREIGVECYYRIQATPWLTLTPDLQYIAMPGALADASDAWIAGLRARITF